ncbi:17646_t:CDS:2 [Dentiscutata erythropus]|uniref:17646_t:CDS:1 n=1 Tax=Dentiscutata erythropus TaxID=1348616 RepID=A0A9N9EYH6_9GLOM|nr:17646_t:CDS:2 [Dentiscutata erythropus]
MPVHLHSESTIIDGINPSIAMEDMINSKNVSVSMRQFIMTHDLSRRHAKSECNGNKIMLMNKEEESNEVIDGINYSNNTTRPSLNSSLSSLPRRKSSVLDISSLLCDLPSTSSPAYDSSIDGDSSMDDISTTSQLGDNESLDSPRSCHNDSPVVRPVLPSIRTFASSPNLRSDVNSDLPHITNCENGNLDSRKSWNHNQPLEQFAAFTTETYRSDSPIKRSSFDVVQNRYTPYPSSTSHAYANQRLLPSVDQRRHSDLSGFTSSRGSGQVHDHSYFNQSHNTHYPHYADRASSTSTYPIHSPPSFAKRKRANANQLKVLNDVFARTFFPSTELRIQLGKELGMAPRTVQIWFQNKRQSWRSKTRGNSNSSIKDEDDRVESDMAKKSSNSRRSSNSGSSSDLENLENLENFEEEQERRERLPTFAQFAHQYHSTNNYESFTSSNRLPAPLLTTPRHHAQPLSSTFEYPPTVSSGI